MKIRNGFVSNSSSSSFVCEVCGDTFEAYNEGPSYFDLVICQDQQHLFCKAHALNPNEDGSYTIYEDDTDDGEPRIDSIHCPICQMKHVTELMMLRYAAKKLDSNIAEIKKEMMEDFSNYHEFEDFLNNNGKKYGVELTANVTVVAPNELIARRFARKKVIKSPVEVLDVTHCEKL